MNRGRILTAASVIMAGTLVTSLLGFVRAFVIARYFGAGASTDAFFAALVVPQTIYDQFIGGAITAVFIPVFAGLAAEDRESMWTAVTGAAVLVGVSLLVTVGVLEVAAHPLMAAVASGFALPVHAGVLPDAVRLVRLTLPSVLFLGISAVGMGVLYALQQRAIASLVRAFFHLGIIGATMIGAARWGVAAAAVGAVVGAVLQCLGLLPALLRSGWRGRIPHWRHPALRTISRLYLPVAAGSLAGVAGTVADLTFKSHLPQTGGLSSMQYATQLIQFPIGIVVAGLGLAILPTLASGGRQRGPAFMETLITGIGMVLVLTVPAGVGFLLLATPTVDVLFHRGAFTLLDTAHTATALVGYAPQLPLVGIVQLLVFAFYARQNTVIPAAVAVTGVAAYVLIAAFVLHPLTILGLALANTAQFGIQMVLLLALLIRTVGSLPVRRLGSVLMKLGVAAGAMAGCLTLVRLWGPFSGSSLPFLILSSGLGGGAYLAVLLLLGFREVGDAWSTLRSRVTGNRITG